MRTAAYIGGLVARAQKRPPELDRYLIKEDAAPRRIDRKQAEDDWAYLKSRFGD